jgi:hypothetical protein
MRINREKREKSNRSDMERVIIQFIKVDAKTVRVGMLKRFMRFNSNTMSYFFQDIL